MKWNQELKTDHEILKAFFSVVCLIGFVLLLMWLMVVTLKG